ncbi:MAG: hypothetical protein U0793_20190 [Gemmataceae bacterium]
MSKPFFCPACAKPFSLPEGFTGGRLVCPSCNKTMAIRAKPKANEPDAADVVEFGCPSCRSVIRMNGGKPGDKTYCSFCSQKVSVPEPIKDRRDKTMIGDVLIDPSLLPAPQAPPPSPPLVPGQDLPSLVELSPLQEVQEVETIPLEELAPLEELPRRRYDDDRYEDERRRRRPRRYDDERYYDGRRYEEERSRGRRYDDERRDQPVHVSPLWSLLVGGGLIAAGYFAFFFDTTVDTGFGMRVHNIGLLNERTTGILCGLGAALLGGILTMVDVFKNRR